MTNSDPKDSGNGEYEGHEDAIPTGEWIFDDINGEYFWHAYGIDSTVSDLITRYQTPVALQYISRELDKAAKRAKPEWGGETRGRPPGICVNGDALKDLRKTLKLTQEELSAKSGVSEDALQRAEAGAPVALRTLAAIVEYANPRLRDPITIDDLAVDNG